MVRVLIAKGASPAIKDEQGKTPLDFAKQLGDEEILEILLSPLALKNSFIGKPKTYVASKFIQAVKEPKILATFLSSDISPNLQDENGNTPLHEAVKLKDLHAVQQLMHGSIKVNLNLKNKKGETPMSIAVANRKKKGFFANKALEDSIIKLLVSASAPPKSKL